MNWNRQYIHRLLLLLIALGLVLNSISCSKRFVGRKVNTNSMRWSKVDHFPKNCFHSDKTFHWEYTIDKGDHPNEYVVTGYADGTRGNMRSIGRLVPSKSNFYIILANDNVIVDTFTFNLPGQSVTSKMNFKKKFTCEMEFNSITIFWQAYFRG
jgi:hypothetical protein